LRRNLQNNRDTKDENHLWVRAASSALDFLKRSFVGTSALEATRTQGFSDEEIEDETEKKFHDGSWLVQSRSLPVQRYFESGFPHGANQWISAAGSSWAAMALILTVEAPVNLTARGAQ
jgi:hypothetical protein